MTMPRPAAASGAPTGHRVTLARIAADANVSLATVSKVLNGRVGVGEETRREVERIAEELGYVAVSERERPLKGTREPLIEIVIDALHSPYALELLSGAIAAAERAGTVLVMRRSGSLSEEPPLKWAQRLARGGRIGVVEVTSTYSSAREKALRSVGLPSVLIDPLDAPRASTRSVGATNWTGGMQATNHLIELGHTDIAYVGGPDGAACDIARTHGYLAAMEQAGLLVHPSRISHGPFTIRHGLSAGLDLLVRRDRPTAIFAASDTTAIGVLEAARRLGIRIPAQLSVVGFDDALLASSSTPPLTTVHQPIAEIGDTAITTILRLAQGQTPPTKRVELATHLIIRASTSTPPEHSSDAHPKP